MPNKKRGCFDEKIVRFLGHFPGVIVHEKQVLSQLVFAEGDIATLAMETGRVISQPLLGLHLELEQGLLDHLEVEP